MSLLTCEDLAMLATELRRADLRIYTAVRMALRDLNSGNPGGVLARLQVDADKLRCHDTPINRLLESH